MTKIGISLEKEYALPIDRVLEIIAKAGFDAVSPAWSEDYDIENAINRARELGLTIQSFHAPYLYAYDMWKGRERAQQGMNEAYAALEVCHKYDIPIMVMHTWIGFGRTVIPNKEGLCYFGEVIGRAAEYGVKIALENTEGEETLFALLEHFKDDPTVGFCWDAGHELCYNRGKDLLSLYGDRLYMTHLHDNLGISGDDIFWSDDLHYLPGDGIIDWQGAVRRLKKAKRQSTINFELKKNTDDRYNHLTFEEYITEAYKRAEGIVKAY